MKTKTNTNIVVLHFKQIFIYKKKKKKSHSRFSLCYVHQLSSFLPVSGIPSSYNEPPAPSRR
jgi:hypothetical protein